METKATSGQTELDKGCDASSVDRSETRADASDGATGVRRSEARAESAVLETCVALLISEPSQALLEAALHLASALGTPIESNTADIDALKQRFYDRFLVSSSPWFVPANEQCIRKARTDGGKTTYPSIEGTHSRHVAECYKTSGFDYRKLQGHAPAVNRLLPDSLASELAFAASLRLRESEAATDEQSQYYRTYADRFMEAHPSRWVDAYSALVKAKGVDFYSEWIALTARIVAAGRPG